MAVQTSHLSAALPYLTSYIFTLLQQQPVINDAKALSTVMAGGGLLKGIVCTGNRIPLEYRVARRSTLQTLTVMLRFGQWFVLMPSRDAADGFYLAPTALVASLR